MSGHNPALHLGQNSYQILDLVLSASMSVRVSSSLRSLRVEIRVVVEVATLYTTTAIITVLLSVVPYFNEQAGVNASFLLSTL